MIWGKKVYAQPEPVVSPGSKAGSKAARSREGQSLVETAVILPILMLMLLGVFEVG